MSSSFVPVFLESVTLAFLGVVIVVVCQRSPQFLLSTSDFGLSGSGRRCEKCFNSGFETERLLILESEVISFSWTMLEEEIKFLKNRKSPVNHTVIERFLIDARSKNDVALGAADVIAKHPLLVFRLKRKIHSSWSPVLEEIKSFELLSAFLETDIGSRMDQLANALLHHSDPQKTIIDILYLQRFYLLATSSLSSGCLLPGSCVDPLTSSEVKVIAQTAMTEFSDHQGALEWIEIGLKTSTEEQLELKTLRARCLLVMERYHQAKEAYRELLLHNSSNAAVSSILTTIDERLKSEENNISERRNRKRPNDDVTMTADYDDRRAFDSLSASCRDKTYNAVSDSTGPLFCYSVCSPNENFTVNVEWLHRRPAVILVHDFFLKGQTDAILRTTRKKSAEEFVLNEIIPDGLGRTDKDGKTVKLGREDQWVDVVESRFRNLTFWESDDENFHLNVRNIGAGWRESDISSECENTTEVYEQYVGIFHVFLNQPEFGGSLIFPKLGVKVEPTQGTAVFWHFRNPKSAAVNDTFIEGIECPVLLGTQWVAKVAFWLPVWEILNFCEDDTSHFQK